MNADRGKYFSSILKYLLGFLFIALMTSSFLLFYFGYDEVVAFLLSRFNMESKALEFKTSFFTHQKFIILKYLLLFFSSLILYFLFKFRTEKIDLFFQNVYQGLRGILSEIKKTIDELSGFQKVAMLIVFILIVGLRIFYFYKFPLFIDEAFSYVYFVSHGFFVSASYYPGPNNHVFYSELCCIAKIFFDDPLFIMRVPSLMAGVVLSFILFLAVTKHFDFYTGILCLVLFSFSEQITFYSIQGRGYILLSLFVMVSGYSLIRYLNEEKEVYLFLFFVSSVLGFYTIPVFLYPFASYAVFVLFILKNKSWGQFLNFVFIFSGIGLLCLVFYMPILLFNDFQTITGNHWVAPSASFSTDFLPYLSKVNNFLWNMNGGVIITILVVFGTLFFFMRIKSRQTILLAIFLITVPLILMLIQKVLPFERIWLYLFLPLAFGLAFTIVQIVTSFINNYAIRNSSLLVVAFFTVSVLLFLTGNSVLNKSFGFYKQMDFLVNKIYQMSPGSILVEDFDCNTFIKYKFIKEKKSIHVESAGSPSARYDMVVANRDFPSGIDPDLYVFGFSTTYVKVYYLKNKLPG